MAEEKKEIDEWHDEPAHIDFMSVYGPLRVIEGVGMSDEDPLVEEVDTLDIPPDDAEIYREWGEKIARGAGYTALQSGHFVDEPERTHDSIPA